MSHKKAKAMRRAVRSIGINDKATRAVDTKTTYVPPPSAESQAPGAMFTGQRKLHENSGRAVYRTLKKADRRGLAMPE